MRQHSFFDRLIQHSDSALRTLSGTHVVDNSTDRDYPAASEPPVVLSTEQKRDVGGLMRVNHTGEVCAQALYAGQALTARLPRVRSAMEHAAQEEQEHLLWCEKRLQELGEPTSKLNPVWYGMSYGIGALAGAAGDRWSLGFVEETEIQVCKHLDEHRQRLPEQDTRTRKILDQMYTDEAKHADMAKRAGASRLPNGIKKIMTAVSKIMTVTAYRI